MLTSVDNYRVTCTCLAQYQNTDISHLAYFGHILHVNLPYSLSIHGGYAFFETQLARAKLNGEFHIKERLLCN